MRRRFPLLSLDRSRAMFSGLSSVLVHATAYGATLAWLTWLPPLDDPTFAGQRKAIQISAVWSVESPVSAVELTPPTPVEVTPTTAQIERHKLRLERTAERTPTTIEEALTSTADVPPPVPPSRPVTSELPTAELPPAESVPATRSASVPLADSTAEQLKVDDPPAESVEIAADSVEQKRQAVASGSTSSPVPKMPEADSGRMASETNHQRTRTEPSSAPPTESSATDAPPPARQPAAAPPSSVSVAISPQELGIDPTLPPSFAGNRPPNYPALAQQRGWEGTVLLRLTIGESGAVTAVELARSSGYEVLDAEAIAAVRTWRGTPARRGGKPVATQELLPVWFRLR